MVTEGGHMRYAERNTAAFTTGSAGRIKIRAFHALEIWQFISILLSALVTGVFWGTWLGLSCSMASLTPETFLTVGHTMIGNLVLVMALLMPAAILATLPVLFLLYRRRSWALYPAGRKQGSSQAAYYVAAQILQSPATSGDRAEQSDTEQ
jgi:hypothetical protein